MHRLALDEEIKKVRITEEEHRLMVEIIIEEILSLKEQQKELDIGPDGLDFIEKEIKLAKSILQKISKENIPKPASFDDLEGDPINNAIRKDAPDLPTDKEMQKAIEKETSSRMGQAGCRGGDCD
tara:strand:- start:7193 stop:7567 length:375 start_codon:yes stop_codon:yes gene_type:complete